MKQLLVFALLLAFICRGQDTMTVDVNIGCDDYTVIYWSVDNFATSTALLPVAQKVWDIAATYPNVPKAATIRIGCWNGGGDHYLTKGGKSITIDGTQHTIEDMYTDGDLVYKGYQGAVCSGSTAPSTLLDLSTVTNDGGALVPHSAGYAVDNHVNQCGIFYVDYTPYGAPPPVMSVEASLNCDNFIAFFWSVDNFATSTALWTPIKPAEKTGSFNKKWDNIPKAATLRIGCWDYGPPGRLFGASTIKIDATSRTVDNIISDGDFVYRGFEDEPCGAENYPTTLSDLASITLSDGDVLQTHQGGYWPKSSITTSTSNSCGIFYMDYTPHPDTCPSSTADTFDWYTLTSDGTAMPEITYDMTVDPDDLSLNIWVEVPYIVKASDSDEDIDDLGTTYVLDFEDYDAHKSSIAQPNSCSNRLAGSYNGVASFAVSSEAITAIGTTKNMCYPPPGGVDQTGWEITEVNCQTIKYTGKWTWAQLRGCRNNAESPREAAKGKRQTEVDDDQADYIELRGVFYVNMVSPFWNVDNNAAYNSYYRVYQLLSKPFIIQVSKSVYVIGSTGVNVMTMSIVAVYKEDLDTDYSLILLTETAEYMQLTKPQLMQLADSPSEQFGLTVQENAETDALCLNPKAFLCSQMWKVYATDVECTDGGIDFGGTYHLKFEPACRTDPCTDWLTDHPDIAAGVELSSKLTFVDKICEAETFKVQLEAEMLFYQEEDADPQYQTAITAVNGNEDYLYQVGKSFVYGEIILDFPVEEDTIFGSELVNVWLCTFPPPTANDPNPPPNPPNPNGPQLNDQDVAADKADNGGCFSTQRDGWGVDNSDFFFHVYGSQTDPPIAEQGFVVIETGAVNPRNRIRYKFKLPRQIQRDTLYVHAQVQVTLQQESARRILLDVTHGPMSNKIAHFGKQIGVTNSPYKKPEPQVPQQPEPHNYYPQQPIQQPPATQPFTIALNSTWVMVIGGILSAILIFNIIFMCYMNCYRPRNGTRPRVSFNKNRRSGYDSVKHADSEEFDDSEANLINVNE